MQKVESVIYRIFTSTEADIKITVKDKASKQNQNTRRVRLYFWNTIFDLTNAYAPMIKHIYRDYLKELCALMGFLAPLGG